MGTIKTKPFDLEAIKNGAKWGIFEFGEGMQYNYYIADLLENAVTHYLSIRIRFTETSLEQLVGVQKEGKFLHGMRVMQIKLIQEPKLASDLSEVKVGDKVWDFLYGWGEITNVTTRNCTYPICVNFKSGQRTYTKDGKNLSNQVNQSIFLTEIKFEIPEV